MITLPILGLVGQFLLILFAFLGFYGRLLSKINSLSSRIEASDKANETLRNDFTGHVQYVKESFSKIDSYNNKIMEKLDELQKGIHDIEINVVGIQAELKFKNGNKNQIV